MPATGSFSSRNCEYEITGDPRVANDKAIWNSLASRGSVPLLRNSFNRSGIPITVGVRSLVFAFAGCGDGNNGNGGSGGSGGQPPLTDGLASAAVLPIPAMQDPAPRAIAVSADEVGFTVVGVGTNPKLTPSDPPIGVGKGIAGVPVGSGYVWRGDSAPILIDPSEGCEMSAAIATDQLGITVVGYRARPARCGAGRLVLRGRDQQRVGRGLDMGQDQRHAIDHRTASGKRPAN